MSLPGTIRGQRALVVGLGREGIDLVRYLVRAGAVVHATDRRPEAELAAALRALSDLPVTYTLGGHPLELLADCDVVFLSPGVAPELPLVAAARQRGLPLSSATELFLAHCPAPIVGLTGSSG